MSKINLWFWITFNLATSPKHWGRLCTAGHAWTHSTKSISLVCMQHLTNISMKKIKDIHAFLPEIFLIRKSCKAEFVKQNFSQIWDLHRGTENFKIFWFRLLPAKVTTKFYEGSETKFKKNSEILHFGSFLVVIGKKKFLYIFFFFFFFSVSRFLLLPKISIKTNEIPRKTGYRRKDVPTERWQRFVAPCCSGYHYFTTSFNKVWTQILRRFQSC